MCLGEQGRRPDGVWIVRVFAGNDAEDANQRALPRLCERIGDALAQWKDGQMRNRWSRRAPESPGVGKRPSCLYMASMKSWVFDRVQAMELLKAVDETISRTLFDAVASCSSNLPPNTVAAPVRSQSTPGFSQNAGDQIFAGGTAVRLLVSRTSARS